MFIFNKKTKTILTAILLALFAFSGTVFAYTVPFHNSNAKYFYVFGKDGDPLMGAEDRKLELFIDVPADEPNDVIINIYDPDTGGMVDWKKPNNEWDTKCEVALYGKELLDKKEFGTESEYDDKWYQFGPYKKTQGEKVNGFYRFRLVVTGLSGDDQNLFKVDILPRSAESFVKNLTIRLMPEEGDQMFFYPEVPAGTKNVIVDNFDLDSTGGTSTLSASELTKKYDIADSESGQWAETIVPISADTTGRAVYIITKATQRYANAGFRIKDEKGNPLNIYFRKSTPPVSEKVMPAPKPVPVKKPDLKCNKYTFDATSSYDVDKQDLSYLWDFGDGKTSTEPVVTHIYDKGGEYTVKLTVTDSSGLPCNSAAISQKVYVNTPPVAAFSAPAKSCAGTKVNFDASATKDDTPGNLTYSWNFGDGSTGSGKTVSHTYEKGGSYDVALMVDDNSGTACSLDSVRKTIRINTAPVAEAGRDIEMCLRSLDEDYTVALDGGSSRDPDGDTLKYIWNLGDGTTKEGEEITHVYQKSGDYKVTLTVDDGSGLACSKAMDTLNVKLNKAPIAQAGKDMDICTYQTAKFDASGSKTEAGETLMYKWAFGDGKEASGKMVEHKYEKGGKYTVLLTVDDGKNTSCSIATDILHVDVNSKPEAKLGDVKDTCVGSKVGFDASGSSDADGDSLDYMWNFGDGTTEKGSSRASHVYSKGGVYKVSVTVDDGKESPCSVDSAVTKVKVNTPPDAMLNVNKACCVNMEQKFDASGSKDADGDSLSYSWDFGDGTSATGAKVSHTYKKPGMYEVILKVDDGSGTKCSTDYATTYINVNAKPVPVIKIK